MMDFKLDFNFDFDFVNESEPESEKEKVILVGGLDMAADPENPESDEIQQSQKSVSKTTINKYLYNRFAGEKRLEEITGWEFEKGAAYHFISMGDIDSLSYLKFLIRQQPLEYCLMSTWGMYLQDINSIKEWIDLGRIKNFDMYVGEIFRNRYRKEWDAWCDIFEGTRSRVCMFRNHTKIIVGFGDKYDFVVESSANINTNPRAENTVITLDTELALYYKNFFDNIKSFERNFDNWVKYEIIR